MNNPFYDFEYEYLKIDVKTARPKWNKSGVATWKFGKVVNRMSDLVYVFFLLPDNPECEIPLDEIEDEDVACLFIPSMLLPDDLKSFSYHEERGLDKYGDFMVELADLQGCLDMIVQAA